MMRERMLLTVGLAVIVGAIYFGYMAYKRRLVVYNGGSSDNAATEAAASSADNAGA